MTVRGPTDARANGDVLVSSPPEGVSPSRDAVRGPPAGEALRGVLRARLVL